MFCLQIHARATCIMNQKFCILHEAAGAENDVNMTPHKTDRALSIQFASE